MDTMFGSHPRVRTKLWLRANALLVLLAWMPSVLAIDHWGSLDPPTEGEGEPRVLYTVHLHGGYLQEGDPHVHRSVREQPVAPSEGSSGDASEHTHAGHGAAGGSVVVPGVPPPLLLAVQLSVLTTALGGPDTAPRGADISPPTPPPPQVA